MTTIVPIFVTGIKKLIYYNEWFYDKYLYF